MGGVLLTWECVFYRYGDIFGISELSFIMEENRIVLSYRERERDKERETERDRETEMETETERETVRDTDGDRDRDRVENSII